METHGRSIPDILLNLVRQLSGLIKSEGQLARAEISEKIDKLAGAGIMIGAGAVLLLPALVILLEAGGLASGEPGWSPAVASLVVAVVVLAIGGVLCAIGLSRLKHVSLVPDKTIRQIQQDVAA